MYKVVLDLEATCCKNNEFPRQEMEIIEFGAVILDENGNTISTFSSFAKPTINPVLTDFCKELTTIRQEDVDSAPKFTVALTKFLNWISEYAFATYEFLSWGDFDKNIIVRQCRSLNYKNPKLDVLIGNHKNAKQLFADKFDVKPMGVSSALKFAKLEFEGTQHRALDDSINIAKLVNLI